MPGWTEADILRRNQEIFGQVGLTPLAEKEHANAPESLIEAECTRFLEQDGWRALRTDPVSDRGRAKGFGEVGMCDHLYMRPRAAGHCCCDVVWVEFKTANRKAGKRQLAWHAVERARGFTVWVANETFPATVDGFREHYAQSGLMRRSQWW